MADTNDAVVKEGADEVVTETPAVAEKVAPVEPEPSGNVTMTAAQFSALMAQIESMKDSHDLLLKVQDKDKIAKIEQMRRSGVLVKSVKVSRLGDKYVIAWKMIQDEVYRNEDGKMIEKQVVRLFHHDGSETDVPLRQWVRSAEMVKFEVKGENRDADGSVTYKVIGDDGLELEIGASFVN